MPAQDKASVTAELEALQLEETRERVNEMRQRRESKIRRVQARDTTLKAAMRRQAEAQANCKHKKGGKGVSQLSEGNDNFYAVVKHQLCHGPIIIICQRCSKVVEPPDPALNRRKASPEDKAEYKRLYDQYLWWLNLPTDNLMSGTQLFMITNNEAA